MDIQAGGAVAEAMVRIGDQIILEENYDETYIPSEKEIQDFARLIGIDPEKEPELIWLAREGIVAPLPPQWKPCQDTNGDVYYFNFANGQSMWDHPCDDHYRELVVREREKLLAQGSLRRKEKKKDKKEKKAKKEKKEKEKQSLKRSTPLGTLLAPIPAPLGTLAPLRGLGAAPATILRGAVDSDVGSSLDSSPMGTGGTQLAEPCKLTLQSKKLLGLVCEERSPLNTAALEEGRNEEEESEESLRGTSKWLKNVHMDVSALGGSFESEQEHSKAEEEQHSNLVADLQQQGTPEEEAGSLGEKESLRSKHPEEGQEASLESAATCPPTLVQALPGDADSNLCGQQEEESDGKLAGSEAVDEEDAEVEVEGDISAAPEAPQAAGQSSVAEPEVPSGQGLEAGRGPQLQQLSSLAASLDTEPLGEEGEKEVRGQAAAADLQAGSKLDAGQLSRGSEGSAGEEELQGCRRRDREQLQPAEGQELREEGKAQSKGSVEEEQSRRTRAAESEGGQSAAETPEEKHFALEEASLEEVVAEELEEGSERSVDGQINPEELKEGSEGSVDGQINPEELKEGSEGSVDGQINPEELKKGSEGSVDGQISPEELEKRPEGSLDGQINPEELKKGSEGSVDGQINPEELEKGPEGSVDGQINPEELKEGSEGSLDGQISPEELEKRPEGSLDGQINPEEPEEGAEGSLDGQINPEELEKRAEWSLDGQISPEELEKGSEGSLDGQINPEELEEGAEGSLDSQLKPEEPQEEAEGSLESQMKPKEPQEGAEGSLESQLKPKEPQEGAEGSLESQLKPEEPQEGAEGSLDSQLKPKEPQEGAEGSLESQLKPEEPQEGAEGSLDSQLKPEEPQEGAEGSLDSPQNMQLEEETKHEKSLTQPGEESLEVVAKELEQEKMQLLLAKEERIHRFQEEMRQQEEEEAEKLRQQKEEALRVLKEDLAQLAEEEELRVRREEAERLSGLRARLAAETRAEEEKMRAEQEATLQRLREEWESQQAAERESLGRKQQLDLEKMKLEMEEAQQREMTELEEEKEQFLRELKERLDREKKEAAEELEKQFAAELQQLRSAAEEKHPKGTSSLQTQLAEAQSSEEAQLCEALPRAEQKGQRKAFHLAEYQRELSELMREKRQEVEKEHERRMQRLKEEQQAALARAREQYEQEERRQRAELCEGLAQLRLLKEAEVKALQAELDQRLTALQLQHQEKERKLQDSESELEIRMKNIQARSAQLLSQEETLRMKKQQLLEEDRRAELEREDAASASRLRLEESRKEHCSLLEATRRLRRALEELQDQKAELEAQVELLQARSQRLQKYLSELEAAVRSRQEALKELEAKEGMESPRRKAELCVEDLQEAPQAHSSREAPSPPCPSHEDSDSQFDHLRSLISAESLSLHSAKEFLRRQARSVRRRHTALRAAKQQWHQDLQKAQEVVQDPDTSQLLGDIHRNLEEEAKQLDKMRSVMRKGQLLLKRKEEKLSQLESSLLEELSDEDSLRSAVCQRVVTFDLSSSEDTNSSSTRNLPQPSLDLRAGLCPALQLEKVQSLRTPLQRINSELSSVLGVLDSLSHHCPLLTSTPCTAAPLPTSASLAGLQAPAGVSLADQWAWGPGLSSALPSAAGQSAGSIPAESWHKYGSGGSPLLGGSSKPLESSLGYVPAGEQIRRLQHSRGSDKMSIQVMIDTNKKWLKDFQRDSKVPLFPGAAKGPASSPSLLQLGLDENRHIKVLHY
ncbi:centrosomal protein of 164 kDa isoform X2 [Pogoniulus pusillus]|uniref:centrosomal protein of 164 kDa isoform X2 n=1 Tax=Pogoniulus pusillus TaxID=488313 RepID=UPI0030B935CD